jgi:hypothetical protein
MKIWLAGNFPQMKDPKLEKESLDLVLKHYPQYNRLLSFYYQEDIVNVISVKKGCPDVYIRKVRKPKTPPTPNSERRVCERKARGIPGRTDPSRVEEDTYDNEIFVGSVSRERCLHTEPGTDGEIDDVQGPLLQEGAIFDQFESHEGIQTCGRVGESAGSGYTTCSDDNRPSDEETGKCGDRTWNDTQEPRVLWDIKFIFCEECHDIFKLDDELRQCKCGLCKGRYDKNAVVINGKGHCITVGINSL